MLSLTEKLLPLAQRLHSPVQGGIEIVVGHSSQGHRTCLNDPLELRIFCEYRRRRRSSSSDTLCGKRSCSLAVVVLEEPTEPFAALERSLPPQVVGSSTLMLRGEGGALMSLPRCPLGQCRH